MAPPSLKDPTVRLIEKVLARLARLERRPGANAVSAADGTTLVGVDAAAAGPALAGLWLPVVFWRRPQPVATTAATDWFGGTVASHTAVWEANFPQQHAKIWIRLITGVTAGPTTGQYRIVADGVTIDEWTNSTVGVVVVARTVALPATWHNLRKVQVSYVRQVGAGAVYCHVTDSYTRET